MITKEQVDKAWREYYNYHRQQFGGPGNGCDDYRDIPDEVFRKEKELEDKARKLQKEYDESFKSHKAIIKKNHDGTYYITDLEGNNYEVHYKIGKTEYKNEFLKNLSWGDIQDIISMYHIEFINYDEIEKENKYVDNDVFQFRITLKDEFKNDEITVYTKPFHDLPLLGKETTEEDWYKEYNKQEDLVQEKYFTQQKIDELKLKLIQKIQECKNPFNIYCVDRDGGYNVTEDQLFSLD